MGSKNTIEKSNEILSEGPEAFSRPFTKNSDKAPAISEAKLAESSESKKESQVFSSILRGKSSVFQPNIRAKALNKMKKVMKSTPLEEIEKIRMDRAVEVINLSGCDLSNPTVFERLENKLCELKKLLELNLSGCHLTIFPDQLPMSLTKLDLKENMIDVFPQLDLEKLAYLDLSYNRISVVPLLLKTSITYLDLHNNKIVDFDKKIVQGLDSLQTLNLSSNLIEKIRFSIENLPSLSILNLSFNKFPKIPGLFFSSNTDVIDKGCNMSITELNLSNNPLEVLHPKIGLLEGLRKLDLRGTKLTMLPTTISRMKNLKYLLLDRIHLTVPPMFVVKKGFEAVMKYLRKNNTISYNEEMKDVIPFESLEETKEEVVDSPAKIELLESGTMMSSIKSPLLVPKSRSSKSLLEKANYFKVKRAINSPKLNEEQKNAIL